MPARMRADTMTPDYARPGGWITREDLQRLEHRIETIDRDGTRGAPLLAVQVQQLAKDISTLEGEIRAHRKEHAAAQRSRQSARRWLIMAIIAVIAAIDGPLVTVLLARH